MELPARHRALALQLRLQWQAILAGTRRGARLCARLSTSCATHWLPLTEQEGGSLFHDVWAARDAYIQVVLDRGAESVDRFFCRAPGACALRGRARPRP